MQNAVCIRLPFALCAFCFTLLANAAAQQKTVAPVPDVTIAPTSSETVAAETIDPASEAALPPEEKLQLIRRHIKYVFVLFQENRSFDFYFASYPGADGLYAGPEGLRTPDQIAGFTQPLVDTERWERSHRFAFPRRWWPTRASRCRSIRPTLPQ
jgi:phospholipase C